MTMKRFSILLALILLIGGTLNAKGLKGNGNIKTQKVEVAGFDEITLTVPATVNFSHSDTFSCSITIDENILPYISFKVVGDDLLIRQLPSKDGKPLLAFNFGEKEVNLPLYKYEELEPTQFVINITAPRLEDVKVVGVGTFCLTEDFLDLKLDVDITGSGQFVSRKMVKVSDLDIDINGSGSAHLSQVNAPKTSVSISGSGTATLTGAYMELDLKVAGSGDIKASGEALQAKAKVAGSGSIRMGNIIQMLDYEIAGSGQIFFSGSAEPRGFIAGSGLLRHVEFDIKTED